MEGELAERCPARSRGYKLGRPLYRRLLAGRGGGSGACANVAH